MSFRPIDGRKIISEAEEYFHLQSGTLYGKDVTARIRDARSIAIYIMRNDGGMSYEEIGDALFRNFASIRDSLKRTESKLNGDHVFKNRLLEIQSKINNRGGQHV